MFHRRGAKSAEILFFASAGERPANANMRPLRGANYMPLVAIPMLK
jgi:hypothetical protein